VFIRITGKQHYLWRAVDQDGHVLDILVQSRRNTKAAKRFFRKLLKDLQYAPRVIVTDKLRSYAAAKREILPHVEHRQSRYLNNRAEVSHTNQRGGENGRCSASSQRGMHSFSCRATAGSKITSNSVAITSPPVNIDPPAAPHSPHGVRSSALTEHRSRTSKARLLSSR
jgi:transposase-like protein